MSIVITGSLGNISKSLAELLIQSGKPVVIITSKTDRKKDIEALGATAAIGSIDDSSFLSSTFAGAETVYAMIPPKFDELDNNAYYRRISEKYATAVREAKVKKVVLLSSYGAHLSSGTGFILGAYHAEQVFESIENISLVVLRPGYFYYNILNFFKAMIQHTGFIGANYGGADVLPLVHPADIAEAAAEEILAPSPLGATIRYIVSDERSANDAARVLGAAINKTDLKWVTFTNEQTLTGMVQAGVPAAAAAQAVELGAALHDRRLMSHYGTVSPTKLGKVKLEDYASEFAAAYNA